MKLNGLDAFATYGIQLREGADEQLLQLPKKKPGYEFSWPDENGTETDPAETPKFERKTYALPIVIFGDGQTDFFANYNALTAFLLAAGEFNLDVEHLGRRYKVRYSEMSAFNKLNMFTTSGLIACYFTLSLTDDYPTASFPIT